MKNQRRFEPYQPNQLFLLPADMKQWLPDDHLVYFVMDVVSQLDLSPPRADPFTFQICSTTRISSGNLS